MFKKLRTKKGFTQQNLANILHVDQTTISKWENGIRYLLIRMREEAIEAALPGVYDKLLQNDSLYLSAKCFPFENNPLISNFAKSKTSKYTICCPIGV